MNQWLESNPGKTERDWLLEERCTSDTQREDLKLLFVWGDKNHRNILVCPTIGSFKDPHGPYRQAIRTNNPHRRAIYEKIHGNNVGQIHPYINVEADFQVVGNQDYYYDLDAPDNVFEQSKPDLYLNWKAEQMSIDPLLAHTNYEIYEAFKLYMGANIPHWRNLTTYTE